MIWVEGRILPDDALSISVLDRTFEHGLGLFETLRTWGGRPTLLEQHKARMLRSARELGIPIDPASLPGADDISRLLEADGFADDRMVRITATGGTASGKSVVWMRSSPLPMTTRAGGAIVCVNSWSLPEAREQNSRRVGLVLPVVRDRQGKPYPTGRLDPAPEDFTARHKTLNYWFKRVAHEQARDLGYDETLILAEPWGYVEASRSNLFLVIDDQLLTISTEAQIVPGIMRRLVLDVARGLPISVQEVRKLHTDQLFAASEIFLTNAVRGITPVARVDTPGGTIERRSPGPSTSSLQEMIAQRLWPDRGTNP